MNNRINVYTMGAGGMQVVGQATAEVGMVVKMHGNTGGSGDTYGDESNTDYLVITAVANDIITAVSHTSSITYKEYAHATYVKTTDTQLNSGIDWPGAAGHFAHS